MRYVQAVPAYGRDYATEEEVKAAWDEGRDFEVQDLELYGYVNKDDLGDGMTLNIRYNKLRDVLVIEG